MNVKFIDTDAVEVDTHEGVLTCFRSNMDGVWHGVSLVLSDGERVNVPTCFVLAQSIIDAIKEVEPGTAARFKDRILDAEAHLHRLEREQRQFEAAKGVPERLGGHPRENVEDAYATFMDMSQREFLGLLGSLIGGGVLTPVEQEGFERACKDRKPPPDDERLEAAVQSEDEDGFESDPEYSTGWSS